MDKRPSPRHNFPMKHILLSLSAVIFLSSCASKGSSEGSFSGGGSIGPNFKYNELMIKDYDEMYEMVQSYVNKAKDVAGEDGTANEDEAIGQLRMALKLIFSRPNSDNMVAKLVPEVRRVLVGFNGFEGSIGAIANEAIGLVKNEDAPASVQSTSLFVLDNILAEIRPEVESNAQMRAIVERVRDAKISVSKDVIKERKVRGMFSTKSPSDVARDLLKKIDDKNKANKKKK